MYGQIYIYIYIYILHTNTNIKKNETFRFYLEFFIILVVFGYAKPTQHYSKVF